MVEQKGDLPVYEVTPEGQKKANQEYSIEISCCLVISCKVICQNVAHNVPESSSARLPVTPYGALAMHHAFVPPSIYHYVPAITI